MVRRSAVCVSLCGHVQKKEGCFILEFIARGELKSPFWHTLELSAISFNLGVCEFFHLVVA